MKRPVRTLFALVSVGGKISTGADDTFDVDSGYPRIAGLRKGLYQYYEIEQTTGLWSLNTGRTQSRLGVNEKAFTQKTGVNFVVLDNSHLTEHGVRYFCSLSREFVLVKQNTSHPGFKVKEDNLHIGVQETSKLSWALNVLYQKYGCERITVQTGGTVNGILLREKLLDYVDIVVALCLLGTVMSQL